jgi:inorganic phosphate transporter, PiT family
MDPVLLAVIVLIIGWLAFEFTNGCHDTAHAVATSIASGALSYRNAVVMSGIANAAGAAFSMVMTGAAVALFIPKIVSSGAVSLHLIGAALVPGTLWNIWTAFKGRPVSSTHCLLSSLIGAGVAAAGLAGVHWKELGLALASLFIAPIIGYALALGLSKLLIRLLGAPGTNPKAEKALPYIQVGSAFTVSFAHGNNDGQKVMGIITMLLAAAYPAMYSTTHVEWWVVALCAVTIGVGTMIGAGPTIRTVGHKMSSKKITSYDGALAESVTAGLILWGGHLGLPLSTTQTCAGSILGASRGIHGGRMQWDTVKKIVSSWLLTFLVCPLGAAASYFLLKAIF